MTTQAAAIAAAGTVSSPIAFGCSITAYGAASLTWNVIALSQRQNLIPDHLFGRVNMTYQMTNAGMSATGAITSGIIAHLLGLRAPFLIGAALLLTITTLTTHKPQNPQPTPHNHPTPTH